MVGKWKILQNCSSWILQQSFKSKQFLVFSIDYAPWFLPDLHVFETLKSYMIESHSIPAFSS